MLVTIKEVLGFVPELRKQLDRTDLPAGISFLMAQSARRIQDPLDNYNERLPALREKHGVDVQLSEDELKNESAIDKEDRQSRETAFIQELEELQGVEVEIRPSYLPPHVYQDGNAFSGGTMLALPLLFKLDDEPKQSRKKSGKKK